MGDYFLNQLEDEFTRKDLLKVVVNKGFSLSKGNAVIEHNLLTGDIVRIGRGKYKKKDNKLRIAIKLHGTGLSYREIAERIGISKSQVANYINEQTGQLNGQTGQNTTI
ncbi:MAG: helix-turn-helix domain-containing protein [Jejuia sp.]